MACAPCFASDADADALAVRQYCDAKKIAAQTSVVPNSAEPSWEGGSVARPEPSTGGRRMALPCRHVFCGPCNPAHPTVCPLCGEALDDVVRVGTVRGVGTKMTCIAELIAAIGPGASILLFVQWKAMVRSARNHANLNAIACLVDTTGAILAIRSKELFGYEEIASAHAEVARASSGL